MADSQMKHASGLSAAEHTHAMTGYRKSSNDAQVSRIDADLLDGLQATAFALATHDHATQTLLICQPILPLNAAAKWTEDMEAGQFAVLLPGLGGKYGTRQSRRRTCLLRRRIHTPAVYLSVGLNRRVVKLSWPLYEVRTALTKGQIMVADVEKLAEPLCW